MKKRGLLSEKEYESYNNLYHSVFNKLFINDIIDCWQRALSDLNAKANDKILDVGDSGLMTALQIFEKYPNLEKISVIDIIDDRYKQAISSRASSIKNKVDFKIMDARKISFKDKSFDKVIATNNINEIQGNWKKAVNEMIRVLKVGGDLILTEHRLNPSLKEDKLFSEVFISLTKLSHANDITLEEIATFYDMESDFTKKAS